MITDVLLAIIVILLLFMGILSAFGMVLCLIAESRGKKK